MKISLLAAAAGRANIHPLTDLIIRTWYEVRGGAIDAAFSNPQAAPPPTESEFKIVVTVLENLVENMLLQDSTLDMLDTAALPPSPCGRCTGGSKYSILG